MRRFDEGEFVKQPSSQEPRMIAKVERRHANPQMDRFKLKDVDGITYGNVPAYELSDATEEEVKAALLR